MKTILKLIVSLFIFIGCSESDNEDIMSLPSVTTEEYTLLLDTDEYLTPFKVMVVTDSLEASEIILFEKTLFDSVPIEITIPVGITGMSLFLDSDTDFGVNIKIYRNVDGKIFYLERFTGNTYGEAIVFEDLKKG